MNLFKSVFSGDPQPSDTQSDGPWGLLRSLASRSESVLETYRRDLQEFGSGLRRETAAFGEAAASAAQDSLESVGRAVDDIGEAVGEIFSQGRNALLADIVPSDSAGSLSRRYGRFEVLVSRLQADRATFLEDPEDVEAFDAWREGFLLDDQDDEIAELCRGNPDLEEIYLELVPEVIDDERFWARYFYKVHKIKRAEDARVELVKRAISVEEEEELSWDVDDADDDVEEEARGNKIASELNRVEEENEKKKLDQMKEQNQIGISGDLQDGDSTKVGSDGKAGEALGCVVDFVMEDARGAVHKEEGAERLVMELGVAVDEGDCGKTQQQQQQVGAGGEYEVGNRILGEKAGEIVPPKSTESKVVVDGKTGSFVPGSKVAFEEKAESSPDAMDSCKDSDFSVVSSQPSMAEVDDLGWDEIEDLGEHDDKKIGPSGGILEKLDMRKRLSIAEDEEDLSWDIEDD